MVSSPPVTSNGSPQPLQPPPPSKPPRPPHVPCPPKCNCPHHFPLPPKIHVLGGSRFIKGIITPKPCTAPPIPTTSSPPIHPPTKKPRLTILRRSRIVEIPAEHDDAKKAGARRSHRRLPLHDEAVKAMLEAISMDKLALHVAEQDEISTEKELPEEENQEVVSRIATYQREFDKLMWETRWASNSKLTPLPPFSAKLPVVGSDHTDEEEEEDDQHVEIISSRDWNLVVKATWKRGMGMSSNPSGWPPCQSKNREHYAAEITIRKEGVGAAAAEEKDVEMGMLLDGVAKSMKTPERVEHAEEDDGMEGEMDALLKGYVSEFKRLFRETRSLAKKVHKQEQVNGRGGIGG